MFKTKREVEQEKVFKKLETWLSLDAFNKIRLAYSLNLKTTNAIDQWLVRGKIPLRLVADVAEIIQEKKNEGKQRKD